MNSKTIDSINWNSEIDDSPEMVTPIVLDELYSINNVYHTVRRTFIDNKDKDFVKSLRDESTSICRESIHPNYIKKAFKKFREGFLYNDEIGKRLGFCIWKINEYTQKYDGESEYVLDLLLICSKYKDIKLGRNIFFDLDNYCRENGIATIKLQAINSAVEKYYQTFGFQTMPKVRETDGIDMVKVVYGPMVCKKTEKNRLTTKLLRTQTRKKIKT